MVGRNSFFSLSVGVKLNDSSSDDKITVSSSLRLGLSTEKYIQ